MVMLTCWYTTCGQMTAISLAIKKGNIFYWEYNTYVRYCVGVWLLNKQTSYWSVSQHGYISGFLAFKSACMFCVAGPLRVTHFSRTEWVSEEWTLSLAIPFFFCISFEDIWNYLGCLLCLSTFAPISLPTKRSVGYLTCVAYTFIHFPADSSARSRSEQLLSIKYLIYI